MAVKRRRKKTKTGRKKKSYSPAKVLGLLNKSAKLIENAAKPLETQVDQDSLRRAIRKKYGKVTFKG